MEYRCRVGTAGGELIDGVYVAESEAQLRRELEEKGLLVLSLRPVGRLAGLLPGIGRRRRIRTPDFLEFNQELATLLKAGMPLVQSLDLLRGGLTDPVFKQGVIDRIPLGRIGETDDIVAAVAFLSSPASDFVTGHNLFLDGGVTATQ